MATDLPSAAEGCVMRVLWDVGESDLAEIHRKYAELFELESAPATIQKLLQRLERKDCVVSHWVGRTKVWYPILDREHARLMQVQLIVDQYFDGEFNLLSAWLQNLQFKQPSRDQPREA